MASSSDSDATSKRKREPSSSVSFSARRMRLSSPTTDPSLSSPRMAGSQTVSRASDAVTETVPETAQLQQQDNDTVPGTGLENVQQQDSEPVHEAEPENYQEQDNGYNADESDNENNDMDADEDEDTEEEELQPVVAELRPVIHIVSRIRYREHNQKVLASSLVKAICADECNSWLELSEQIRVTYNLIADKKAVGHEVVHDGNIVPPQSWPGRRVRFYSVVEGHLIERFWPQDDWAGLDLTNNLRVVALDIPKGRACHIVWRLDSETYLEMDQIVIQKMASWHDFAASIRVVFYSKILLKQAPHVEEVSPFNCCPGADVTFWGDLREEWFYGGSLRDGHGDDNWSVARLAICKVVIV